ncbi:MAG: hypothetical protein ACLPUG_12770 [Acidimicrobiales bacterium]
MAAIAGVIVLAIVAAQVAADVVNSGTSASRVAAQNYVAEVIPVIDESTTLASTVHLVRENATSLDRTALEADLGALVAGTSDDLAQLGSLGVPAPSPRSEDLLRAVLTARALAATTLTGAIALAIGPEAFSAGSTSSSGGGSASSTLPSPVAPARARAVQLVVQAGLEMALSDRDYRSFVSSLPQASGRGRLPSSTWVTHSGSWAEESATSWVARLSSTQALQIRYDLLIVAVTVQPPVVRITGLPTTTTFATTTSTSTSTTTLPTVPVAGTFPSPTSTSTSSTSTTLQLPPPGSTSVLPPTHQLLVVLVVANSGDVQIPGIWAAASVVPDGSANGTPTSRPASRSTALRVGLLQPGASVEVRLPPLSVAPGDAYKLWVSTGTGSLPRAPVIGPPKGVGQIDEVKIKVASG